MDTDKILLEQFITSHPAQAAQAIEKLRDEEIAAFMEQMPLSLNINLINQIETYKGAKCLQSLRPDLAKELIENVEISLAESLLRQLETPSRLELLNNIEPKLATTLRQKLEYEANTIGAMMIPSVFALSKFVTVRDALVIVKQETTRILSVIYVVNEEDKLEGNVMLHELLFADPSRELYKLINTETPKFIADMSIKSVSDHPGWQAHRSIPVIDRSEKLIGILDFAAIQKENDKTEREMTKEVLETSNSLGELYRIGLTGFLQSISR